MMYVELHKEIAEKLEEYLKEQEISYHITSVPLVNSVPIVHIDFDCLTESQKKEVLEVVEQLKSHKSPTRHRPWDEKMHTPMEEFKGWWTGKNTEEEVEYGREGNV